MPENVDVLMTPEGLVAFRARFVGRGYVPAFPGAHKTFRDAQTRVRIVVVTSGEYPGDGLPKPVVFPNPDEAWVEVEAGDFMWLRAFCPQACYAGGPGQFRYLLYKDVNRHARLSPSGMIAQ